MTFPVRETIEIFTSRCIVGRKKLNGSFIKSFKSGNARIRKFLGSLFSRESTLNLAYIRFQGLNRRNGTPKISRTGAVIPGHRRFVRRFAKPSIHYSFRRDGRICCMRASGIWKGGEGRGKRVVRAWRRGGLLNSSLDEDVALRRAGIYIF